jgi:hypothetical protein
MRARDPNAHRMSAWHWRRAFALWLAIAVAESLHGAARGLWLLPVVGPLRAHQIGVGIACVLIFAIAWAGIRWLGSEGLAQQLQVGLLWVVLMLSFEIALGLAQGIPIGHIAAEYDPRQGGLMAFGMLFLFASPALAAKMRGRR